MSVTAGMASLVGGGTLPPSNQTQAVPAAKYAKATNVDREQVADMIAASEARVEAKFERLLGEFRQSLANISGELKAIDIKISERATTWQTVSIVAGGIVTAVVLVVAIWAFNGDSFSRGFDAAEIAERAAEKVRNDDAAESPKRLQSAQEPALPPRPEALRSPNSNSQ